MREIKIFFKINFLEIPAISPDMFIEVIPIDFLSLEISSMCGYRDWAGAESLYPGVLLFLKKVIHDRHGGPGFG